MKFLVLALTLSSSMVLAQAPTFTDAQSKKFFKAQSEAVQAQVVANQQTELAQKKQDALQSVVAELSKVCGDKFSLSMGKDGEIYCQPKPDPAKVSPTPDKK
jgi:hypothetical protein